MKIPAVPPADRSLSRTGTSDGTPTTATTNPILRQQARPRALPPRLAAEKDLARFARLNPASAETQEDFIHLVVGRGFGPADRRM